MIKLKNLEKYFHTKFNIGSNCQGWSLVYTFIYEVFEKSVDVNIITSLFFNLNAKRLQLLLQNGLNVVKMLKDIILH